MSDRPIDILHVGSASRDLVSDDPRGWRLGGGVTYAALTTARLGLRTAAIVGADAVVASAAELDLLRGSGVELFIYPLAESPVFRNVEAPAGRVQACLAAGRPLGWMELPAAWRAATAWSLVPVAGEIGEEWAPAVPDHAFLALGWQGLLRELLAGKTVARRAPAPSALLRRAQLVGVSRHDLPSGMDGAALRQLLGPGTSLVLTDGEHGGHLLRTALDGTAESWRYDAVTPDVALDPTGAGDVFLAALLASLVRPSTARAGEPDLGRGLAFAAAAASLVIERPGLQGVPDLAAVQARARRARRGRPASSAASDG